MQDKNQFIIRILDSLNPFSLKYLASHYGVNDVIKGFDLFFELFLISGKTALMIESFKFLNNKYLDDRILLRTTFNQIECMSNDNILLVSQFLDTKNNYFNLGEINLPSFLEKRRPLIMGILNVTPDSFSDGGKYFDKESAVKRAFELIEEGADIVDIGGESTRPGAEEVSVDEELKRTIPVIEEICKSRKNIFVSIDTTKPEVAEAALSAGALIVNDISGGEFYPKIHEIVNKMKAIYVLMHTTGKPVEMQKNINYKDITGDVYLNLISKANKLRANGLENIIIDPGIGFGKTVENNYEILSRLNEFTSAGYPLLTGVSRKSFLRKSLNIQIEDSDTASVIMDSFALQKGTSIIRTHNVKMANLLKKIYTNTSNYL